MWRKLSLAGWRNPRETKAERRRFRLARQDFNRSRR
jgi:hypothetical protein